MKKLVLIIISILTIFILTGCTNEDIGAKSKYDITNDQVTMRVKEGTLTNSQAIITMINNTEINFTYGEPYHLEKKVNGTWYELEPIEEVYFTMPAYVLKAKESVEKEYNWEYGYGKLKKGTYRLVTDFSNGKEQIYASAEFTIN